MNNVIRRYFKFASFVDLMTRSRLFFPSLHTLRREDPFEGALTVGNYVVQTGMAKALDIIVNDIWPKTSRQSGTPCNRREWPPCKTVFGEIPTTSNLSYNDIMEVQHKWLDVHCWHERADESVAMWKIYGGVEPSVCVVSTPEKLSSSLRLSADLNLRMESVRYLDYDEEFWEVDDPLEFAFTKRKAYSYEQEFRAMIFDPTTRILDEQGTERNGRYVDVNIEALISEIRVSPKADNWFVDLVKHIVPSALSCGVHRSKLDGTPIE